MSAMHWEARRRQQVLDRRLLNTRVKQDEMNGKNEAQTQTHSVPAEVDKKCICKCQPVNEETWDKSNKRYSSLEYSQQW